MDKELNDEIARLNLMPPMQAAQRLRELRATNPALIQRMMPTAEKLWAEVQRTNPGILEQVAKMIGHP